MPAADTPVVGDGSCLPRPVRAGPDGAPALARRLGPRTGEAQRLAKLGADQFSLALSRPWLRAGPAVVELVNYGEDEHDLALRRSAPGSRMYRIAATRPGRVRELELRLVPGRYALWCTLAGHRARGMHATLVVRRA